MKSRANALKPRPTNRRAWLFHLTLAALPFACAGAVWAYRQSRTVERDPHVVGFIAAGNECLRRAVDHGQDPDVALSFFRRALTYEPGCPEALRGIGIVRILQKSPHEGLQQLMEYLKKNPDDAEANLWTARGYKAEGSAELALLYYERACTLDSQSVEARKEVAKLYIERRNPVQATAKLVEAVALAPKDEEAQRLMSMAMEMQTALAREPETRSGLRPPSLGPTAPNPLAEIEASRPRVQNP